MLARKIAPFLACSCQRISITHVFALLQAQSFFASLPHTLAARLQQSPCIPTETGCWVTPKEAVVCQDPQVRALLADPRLPALATLQYAHSGLTALYSSQPLRALLGVGEVAHGHLLEVARKLHSSQMLTHMGFAWIAQLLLCVFESLQQERPGGMGNQPGPHGSPAAVATAAAKAATAELKQLLLLPLADGAFAPLERDGQQQPMYFPLGKDSSPGLPSSSSARCCSTGHAFDLLLRRLAPPLRMH